MNKDTVKNPETDKPETTKCGALDGLRVFDMTRILAGPAATQILGDMGAEILKIEKPLSGDDTRQWGPPFLKDAQGQDTGESAYYLCANRNKKSVTLDYTRPEGLAIAKKLIGASDIFFENYKMGTLEKYGLGYEQLRLEFPRLIYCSLTGFGHSGPYQNDAGYDFMIQGMGGIMSLTGEPQGEPVKIAVAYADLATGLYAAVGILAALHHRDKTGQGQFIDISLLDTQVAMLANLGQSYLTSGIPPQRMGNAHAAIVPYQAFATQDGHIILAVGNDKQFAHFCGFAGKAYLAEDVRFKTNQSRLAHRDILVPVIQDIIKQRPQLFWIEGLKPLGVPCGPINSLDQVFADPQVTARGMAVSIPHPLSDTPVKLLANPLRLSETPVSYRHAPPTLSADTAAVLKELLNLDTTEIITLQKQGVI
jgi:crotonobetainyl-CoA:carnitine CoA-transferase CaiB-like acyl-CoA transferase